jgi:outer membrane protein assembly factor BamB
VLLGALVSLGLALGPFTPVSALPPDLDSPLVYAAWRSIGVKEGLPSDSIRSVRVVDDQVWVGTDGGISRLERGEWKSWTAADGLPPYPITAIDFDHETRDLWLGTWGDGIVRFTAGRADNFNQFNSGLAGDLIFDVVVVDGRVWAATNGGLCAFNPLADAWELYHPRRANERETAVTDLLHEGGSLYALLWRTGLEQLDIKNAASHPSTLQPFNPAANEGVIAFALNQRMVYQADPGALHRHSRVPREGDSHAPAVERRLPRIGSSRPHVQCLNLRSGEEIWVGTQEGLHMLADGASSRWITYRSQDDGLSSVITMSSDDVNLAELRGINVLPDDNVRCIAFDRSGIWVGTARGLAHGSHPIPFLRGSGQGTQASGSSPVSADLKGRTVGRGGNDLPPASPPSAPSDNATDVTNPSTLQPFNPSTLQPFNPVTSLAIAIFGPRNRTINLPGKVDRSYRAANEADLVAVELAVEHASAPASEPSAQPLHLEHMKPSYRRYGWGLPEDDMIAFARNPRILGIVGAISAEQFITDAAAARTEVPWVNLAPTSASTPVSVEARDHYDDSREAWSGGSDRTSNPWVFQCWGDLPRQHRLLLDYVFGELGCSRPAALSAAGGPSSGVHLDWWADHARLRGNPVVAELEWDPDTSDLSPQRSQALRLTADPAATWETLRRVNADVVLTWCDKPTAVKILQSMRKAGMRQLFVGGPAIVADDFMTLVGGDPGPVIALMPQDSTAGGPSDDWFRREYMARNTLRGIDAPPDARASRSRVTTEHLIDAIRRSAPDRPSVRRTLEAMSRSAGGEAHYERLHEKGRAIIARLEGGHWVTQKVLDSSGD